jgi:hypothetical protein
MPEKKFLPTFDTSLLIDLMRRFKKICKKLKFHNAVWQHFFALPISTFKEPSWGFNFLQSFEILSSNPMAFYNCEYWSRMLVKLFMVFLDTINLP